MRPFRHILWVALGAPMAILAVPQVGQAQHAYTLEPPADIAGLLDRLKRPEGWAAATRALAGRDDAAPYLRMELATARDRFYKGNLREALDAIEGRVRERNRLRFEAWAKERRLDLCNELITSWPDKKEAVGLVDRLLQVIHKIGAEATDQLNIPFGICLPDPFSRTSRGFPHLAEEEVTVGWRARSDPTLIRADRCELEIAQMSGWFVAVRAELRHKPVRENAHAWDGTVALVNGSTMPIVGTISSVIVCDGDVEFLGLGVQDSVIIANGSIRPAVKDKWPSIRRSVLYAAGDIECPLRGPGSSTDPSRYYASGSVKFAGKAQPDDQVREKVAGPPFGVRFLDPREFGLELAAEAGGLRVARLADWSPFAKHGVREGDVITKINDADADSVPAFRRELRRRIVIESAVFRVLRKGEALTRIVFLDGIPTDPARIAPMPREVKR